MIGLIAGVVIGAAAAVIIVGTGGGALVVAATVGAGISAGGGIGELVGRHFIPGIDRGPILLGVPTVLIEYLPAAVVTTPAACAGIGFPHPGSLIAQGSSSVFIGGLAAARIGDKLTCGAKVGHGCSSVDIGGGTVTYLEIDSEVPAWLSLSLTAIGFLSGVGALRTAGMSLFGAVAWTTAGTASGAGWGMGAGWVAEQAGFESGSLVNDLAVMGGGMLSGKAAGKAGLGKSLPGGSKATEPIGGLAKSGVGSKATLREQRLQRVYELREKRARDFYKQHNPGMSDADIDSHIRGIDYSKRVKVVKIGSDQKLNRYVRTEDGKIIDRGEYFTRDTKATPSELGIADYYEDANGQINMRLDKQTGVLKQPDGVENIGLESTAQAIPDDFSIPGIVQPTDGGANQIYIPRSQDYSFEK